MKIISVMFLFACFNTFAMSGKEAWIHSNMKGKVKLIKEYRSFFEKLQAQEKLGELDVLKTSVLEFIMSSAWAETQMDCIYAGWPSKRVNNLCSSPLRHNPDYQKGSCGTGQLQCQPLLFGKGLCVSVNSQSERSMAFTNCDKKFQATKTSPEALIKEIRADGNEKSLFELMDFADKICQDGAQSGTGMCRRLAAAVDRMRHFKNESSMAVLESKSDIRSPAVVSSNNAVLKSNSEQRDLIESVQTVTSAAETMKAVVDPDCEPVTNGDPFDRDEPRPLNFEYSTSRQGKNPAWDDTFVKDKNEEGLRYTGFEITNAGPNDIAGDAIDPREKTERTWRFASEDNSKRETYLWITDDSGSGFISGLMESVIMLVPRKMKPQIEAIGDDLHVTLTTGEKVIYDKKTKMIKAGALREGKVDLNPNKHQRKFAPISYSGTGISIRVDRRGEDPRLITGSAVVTQNGITCQVPARELWDAKADFKYSDDSKLIEHLNKKCGKKFSL